MEISLNKYSNFTVSWNGAVFIFHWTFFDGLSFLTKNNNYHKRKHTHTQKDTSLNKPSPGNIIKKWTWHRTQNNIRRWYILNRGKLLLHFPSLYRSSSFNPSCIQTPNKKQQTNCFKKKLKLISNGGLLEEKSLFFYLENMIMLCDDDDGKTLNISFVCWDVTNGGWKYSPFFCWIFLQEVLQFSVNNLFFVVCSSRSILSSVSILN